MATAIENDRQYEITKTWAEKFRKALYELSTTPRDDRMHPTIFQAQKDGLHSQLEELDSLLAEYDARKANSEA